MKDIHHLKKRRVATSWNADGGVTLFDEARNHSPGRATSRRGDSIISHLPVDRNFLTLY
jgi:hypothetical protein